MKALSPGRGKAPREGPVTIAEVARVAGVSPATVSRVLNGTARVSERTRERVTAAVRELAYRPNIFARSLVTNRSNALGIVVIDVSSPFFGAIVAGIESVADAHGFHLLVTSGHADARRELAQIEFLAERRVDALILFVEEVGDYDLLSRNDQGPPVVLIGRSIPELEGRCVYVDNELAGWLATRRLIAAGHTRIAHITGPLAHRDARNRLAGHHRALTEAGLAYDERLVVEGDFQESTGVLATHRLLERGYGFTALFAANDQTALGAYVALRERGLGVPDDISVIGVDDVLFTRFAWPPLTTVAQPLNEMGECAARLALRSLGVSLDIEPATKLDPALVERASVAPPRSEPASTGPAERAPVKGKR